MKERFQKKNSNICDYSEGFKQLIFNLLSYNPDSRMTIEELK